MVTRMEAKMTDHIYDKHENCTITNCMICDGGLALCIVCGGLEGGLPTECPGERMTNEQQDAVYSGRIDFVGGVWVDKAISVNSPVKYRI
jgi:hypothetical protein